jgi:hypothetical protein
MNRDERVAFLDANHDGLMRALAQYGSPPHDAVLRESQLDADKRGASRRDKTPPLLT